MRRGLLLAIAWMILATTGAVGQNLVTNGDFDQDIAGWEAQPTPPGIAGAILASHDPAVDALGITGSGSLVLEWDLTDPTGMVPNGQTILKTCSNSPLPPGGILLPSGWAGEGLSPVSGDTFLLFCDYPQSDCTGGSSCGVRNLPALPGGIVFDLRFATSDPAGAQSVGVEVVVEFEPDGMGSSVAAGGVRLDKIFLREEVQPDLIAMIELLGTAGTTVSLAGVAADGQSPFEPIYLWNFGDGTTSTEQNPTHTYSSAGTFVVTLSVDSGYEQGFDQLNVTVSTSATEIPTVSSVGLAVLAAILGLGGMILLRSRGFFPGS